VGWSGLGPVSVLLEYVFGLRPSVPTAELTWDVRLLDAFGVAAYPFGVAGTVELSCAKRSALTERPVVTVKTNVALTLRLQWGGRASPIGGVEVEREALIAPPPFEEVHRLPAGWDGVVPSGAAGGSAGGAGGTVGT
jgi:hypothetical protein